MLLKTKQFLSALFYNAFCVISWVDFYMIITQISILGVTRTWRHLIADVITTFILQYVYDTTTDTILYGMTLEHLNKERGEDDVRD